MTFNSDLDYFGGWGGGGGRGGGGGGLSSGFCTSSQLGEDLTKV